MCTFPHEGPFCQFQCTKEQIDKNGGLCQGTQSICRFDDKDYNDLCINSYNIQVLDGPLLAHASDLHTVDVSWQTANYTTYYQYVINIRSATDNEGEIRYRTFSLDGIRKNISVQEMDQDGFTDVQLKMQPYTNYSTRFCELYKKLNPLIDSDVVMK